jgi:hypothetical protein
MSELKLRPPKTRLAEAAGFRSARSERREFGDAMRQERLHRQECLPPQRARLYFTARVLAREARTGNPGVYHPSARAKPARAGDPGACATSLVREDESVS